MFRNSFLQWLRLQFAFSLYTLQVWGNAKIAVHAVPNLGSFKWEQVNDKRMLGEGSFGYVLKDKQINETVTYL